jgi:SAM-dependent methyltransferase
VTNMADPAHVREQYAAEDNLETRRSVWQPDPELGDPLDVTLDAITAALPEGKSMPDVLEVGSGPGVFAARLQERHPNIALLATDQSPRFVELTRERGVPAQLMDVQHLLPGDDTYDVVVAMWMLYHVPDLHRGLAEIRRVLRPGGTFVAVTNGDEHIAGLRRAAGGDSERTQFSTQNGEPALRQHFDVVERVDLHSRAVFPDHASAQAYLDSSGEGLVLPPESFGDGPRKYAGEVTVFTAR